MLIFASLLGTAKEDSKSLIGKYAGLPSARDLRACVDTDGKENRLRDCNIAAHMAAF